MRLSEKRVRAVIREAVRQILSESEGTDFDRLIDSIYEYDREELEGTLAELNETGGLLGANLTFREVAALRDAIESRLEGFADDGDGDTYVSAAEPNTVIWTSGPVDHAWLAPRLKFYRTQFSPQTLPYIIERFMKLLNEEPEDSDFVREYINSDGTSKITRETMEELVIGMQEMASRR